MSNLIYDIAKKVKELEQEQQKLKQSLEKSRKQNVEIAKKVGAPVTDTDAESI